MQEINRRYVLRVDCSIHVIKVLKEVPRGVCQLSKSIPTIWSLRISIARNVEKTSHRDPGLGFADI